MKVLDHGECTLVEHMSVASDIGVVQSARISQGAALPEWRGASDEKLINFLATNEHVTPFEHNLFTFYVRAPIFVIREWQRHRAASYNERSARFKELDGEFHIPSVARVQDAKNKQSSQITEESSLTFFMTDSMQRAY